LRASQLSLSLALLALVAVSGCTTGDLNTDGDFGFADAGPGGGGTFICIDENSIACRDNVFLSCTPEGEFFQRNEEDCTEQGLLCVLELGGCRFCRPGQFFCEGNDVVECNDEGTGGDFREFCDPAEGFACRFGECVDLCEQAQNNRSYEGCEFYAVDLDNASIANPVENPSQVQDASAQQFAVVVSNPNSEPVTVTIERNDGPPGGPPEIVQVGQATIVGGDLEEFLLDPREVDGKSTNQECDADSECSADNEACYCAEGVRAGEPGAIGPCRCRTMSFQTCGFTRVLEEDPDSRWECANNPTDESCWCADQNRPEDLDPPLGTTCNNDADCPNGGSCDLNPEGVRVCGRRPCFRTADCPSFTLNGQRVQPVCIEDAAGEGYCAPRFQCFCRGRYDNTRLNDGTHSAITSNAYRVRSTLPVIAYQFNPFSNVGVFSNDASLLLPTSAISSNYTVVGWPQTIADSPNADTDFIRNRADEDLRAFLTIVGTEANTEVTVNLGLAATRVIGIDGAVDGRPGSELTFNVGPFDVVNLETGGFNADFTGTRVETNGSPVAVFTGSEASDAPRFNTLSRRSCCADHLEEQLFPRDSLGRVFYIGHMPKRTTSVNEALTDPGFSVGEPEEPEFIRIVAVEPGETLVRTTLPNNPSTLIDEPEFVLQQGQNIILESTTNFRIEGDGALAVMQVIASQGEIFGNNPAAISLPGGDPAAVIVPPVEQYREEYVFLVPRLYGFDYIVIIAPREAEVLLDEAPLPDSCIVTPADGIVREDGDVPPEFVTYQCQVSFPDVIGQVNQRAIVDDGIQFDGVHRIRASREIGIMSFGFDNFVSYAFAGGLDLEVLDP
jgi:hypothetical protein